MPRAGDLRHRAAFDKRGRVNDGAGNWRSGFVEQFSRAAAYTYAGGGEAIMAARLEGRGVLKVRLRSDPETRSISSEWQMRDVRTRAVYAIKAVDFESNPKWVYLVVERGSAA